MFNKWHLYIFMYVGAQHDFNVRWCSCHLQVTRQVSLVEQELQPSGASELTSYVCGGFVLLNIFFCLVYFPFSLDHFIIYPISVLPFYCLSFLRFAILLSILWSTSSDWYLQIYLKHIDTPHVLVRFDLPRSLVFYVVFCRSLFVLLSVLFWPLYFLAFHFFWLPLCYLQTYLKHIDARRVLARFTLLDL